MPVLKVVSQDNNSSASEMPNRRSAALIEGTVPSLSNPPPGCRFADRCKHAMPACRTATPALVEAKPGHKVACILDEFPA